MPCPIHAADDVTCAFPSLTVIRQRPVSGMPTPRPLFLRAQAIPTLGFFSHISLTDSNASAIAVVSSAICPFGIISPGFKAFLRRISKGDIPTISASLFRLHSVAKQLCVTPKPLNAPAGGLFV